MATIKDLVTFSRSSGRVVVESWGDSTTNFDGDGHSAGLLEALCDFSYCAGIIVPPNHTNASDNYAGYPTGARRNDNRATIMGVTGPQDVMLPGYPTSFKQYGAMVPVVGFTNGVTTLAANLTAGGASATVTDGSSFQGSGLCLCEGEIMTFSRSTNTLTLTRAQYGTRAVAHNSPAVVQEITVWLGPQPAYLGSTTLNGAITAGSPADAGTLNVASTNEFPSNARAHLHDGTNREIISWTGVTTTTCTNIDRGNLSTTPRDWADGSRLSLCYNGIGWGGKIPRWHAIGPTSALTARVYWLSVVGTTVNGATVTPQIASTVTDLNTDTTWTNQATGSATNMTNFTVGSLQSASVSLASAARDDLSLNFGSLTTNGSGPFGPACITNVALYHQTRPYGIVQAMGNSLGGRRAIELIRECRRSESGVVEFDLGLRTRIRTYLNTTDGACAVANGGNGTGAVLFNLCFGHNEGSGSPYTALPDETESWTVRGQSTVDGTVTALDTTITLAAMPSGMQSTGFIKLVDGGRTEFVYYSGISGNNLTGCIRGLCGTAADGWSSAATAYFGWPVQHPQGFAASLLFLYKLFRAAAVAEGFSTSQIWVSWTRPIPVSGAPVAIDDINPISTNAQKEYKHTRFAEAVRSYLEGRENFFTLDHSQAWDGGGDTASYQYGDTTSDLVHNERQGYALSNNITVGKGIYSPIQRLRGR